MNSRKENEVGKRWKALNVFYKGAIICMVIVFLLINPYTRGPVVYLVMPTGWDDLVLWLAAVLAVGFFFGGTIKSLLTRYGGATMQFLRRFFPLLVLVTIVPLFSTGCFFRQTVEENEVGLFMSDGARVDQVWSPGRYTNLGVSSRLENISTSAVSISWEDPNLITSDLQPIGLKLVVTVARSRDDQEVRRHWSLCNSLANDDAALMQEVLSRIGDPAKNTTRAFTIRQMLGIDVGGGDPKAQEGAVEQENSEVGRELVRDTFTLYFKPSIEELGLQLRSVRVDNISPSDEWIRIREATANESAKKDLAEKQKATLEEQLLVEAKTTAIEVEKANRQNLVNAELAKTYSLSPAAYELKRLELMERIIGGNDKFVIVPQGADITLLFGSEGFVPLPQAEEPQPVE